MFSQWKLFIKRQGGKYYFLFVSDQLCFDCDSEDWNPTQGSHKGEMTLLHKAKGNCIRIRLDRL